MLWFALGGVVGLISGVGCTILGVSLWLAGD